MARRPSIYRNASTAFLMDPPALLTHPIIGDRPPPEESTTMPTTAPYVHKEPPLAVQALVGAVMYGIAWPVIRTFEGLGRGPQLMAKFAAGNHRRVEAA